MNSYNTAFMDKCQKSGKALTHLNKIGCAILGMTVGDNGSQIEIPPPMKNQLTGVLTVIKGGLNGRKYEMRTRVHDCTVRWVTTDQPQIGQ